MKARSAVLHGRGPELLEWFIWTEPTPAWGLRNLRKGDTGSSRQCGASEQVGSTRWSQEQVMRKHHHLQWALVWVVTPAVRVQGRDYVGELVVEEEIDSHSLGLIIWWMLMERDLKIYKVFVMGINHHIYSGIDQNGSHKTSGPCWLI